ncbi:cell wall-binding repeat-containing protein [Nitriliruptoria bacterium AS10]|nr:cell wall-binding repeat-containing protein [Salsipaludibacter albus]MBY5163292.1 cell wall-binding repeat-containing protein [Salsipaludibacter albus]
MSGLGGSHPPTSADEHVFTGDPVCGPPGITVTSTYPDGDIYIAAREVDGPILFGIYEGPELSPGESETFEVPTEAAYEVIALLGDDEQIASLEIDVDCSIATSSRLAGSNRYATAVAVSQYQFPAGSSRVYLARGREPLVDALAGGALTDGPVLLVPATGAVPQVVLDEIDRLSPGQVVALGGPAAITDTVLADADDAVVSDPTYPRIRRVNLEGEGPQASGIPPRGEVAITADGSQIFYITFPNHLWQGFYLHRYSVDTGERQHRLVLPSNEEARVRDIVDVSNDGETILVEGSANLSLLDFSTGELTPVPNIAAGSSSYGRGMTGDAGHVLYQPDPFNVSDLAIWERSSGAITEIPADDAYAVATIAESVPVVAYTGNEGRENIRIYDHRTGTSRELIDQTVDCRDGMELSDDGSALACATTVWSTSDGSVLTTVDDDDVPGIDPQYARVRLNGDGTIGLWFTQDGPRGWWHMDMTGEAPAVHTEATIDGSQPTNPPSWAEISADGHRVAILSSRPNMVAGDTEPYTYDVFLWEAGPP